MKKKSIFKHEINESVQAHAAMNCLRNRNNMRQMNESACGAQEQEESYSEYVSRVNKMSLAEKFDERFKYDSRIRNMANDVTKEAYMIILNEYGDGMWRQLGMDDCDDIGLVSQLNDYQEYYDITNPQDIVDCMLGKKSVKSFNTAREEQEEITGDKAEYAMELVKKFENDVPKVYKSTPEVFMMEQLLKVIGWDISKKEYNEWWELLCDACEEVFGSGYREWSKNLLDAMEEQEEVRSSLPAQYEEFVLPDVCDMVVDRGVTEEEVKALLLKSPKLPWEYDEIEEWVAKNFPEEQEEVKLSESEIEELTFKLADYLMESFIVLEDEDEDYSNLLEAVEKILRKDAPKSDSVAAYYAWCRKWFMKIEDLTYSYYNEPNPESYYSDEEEENVYSDVLNKIINDGLDYWDVWEMVNQGKATKTELEISNVLLDLFETLMYNGYGEILSKVSSGEIDKRELKRIIVDVLMEQGVDTFPSGESEYNSWVDEHNSEIVKRLEAKFGEEEEEYDMTPSYQAYYSEDEPDYENDHHGIWLIINIMRKKGMLRAQGIEGRDDVDDGHAINAAYDLIEQKLNDEGMWIGDDDHEAERFVSFFGEEIAEEAMKSAIHNQEQEELPQMERHDMILALSEYMAESWIATDDEDGDLDDIYYAIADILDKTGDYPASTSWEDCKPWCQKHYREVEETFLGGGF